MNQPIQKISRLLFAASLFLFATNSQAASYNFNNLSSADYDKIVNELSANFNYTTVTPASSLGSVWGFEFGVVAGQTKTPDILGIVKRADPNTSLKDSFYHGGAIARLGVPLGITAEFSMIPKISGGGASFKQTGGAAQWTITDVFFTELPVALAIKGYYTQAKLSFSEVINNSSTANTNVNSTINFKDTIWGTQAKVSKKFLVFEPYAGVGYAKANGTLDINAALANATIFSIPGVTNSASSSSSSMTLTGGLDIQLLFLSIGAEYARAFSKNSYNARVSFRF